MRYTMMAIRKRLITLIVSDKNPDILSFSPSFEKSSFNNVMSFPNIINCLLIIC